MHLWKDVINGKKNSSNMNIFFRLNIYRYLFVHIIEYHVFCILDWRIPIDLIDNKEFWNNSKVVLQFDTWILTLDWLSRRMLRNQSLVFSTLSNENIPLTKVSWSKVVFNDTRRILSFDALHLLPKMRSSCSLFWCII